MKITNYKEAATKEERLAFINNFIEFFIEEYNSSKIDNKNAKQSTIENNLAVFPCDNYYITYRAISKDTDGNFRFIENFYYSREDERNLNLSSNNGNTIKSNFNYITRNVLTWNDMEEKFQQFLFNKTLSRFQTTTPTKQKTMKI